MRVNLLKRLTYAIECISLDCGVDTDEVIDALIGVAWDEEEAGELKDSLRD